MCLNILRKTVEVRNGSQSLTSKTKSLHHPNWLNSTLLQIQACFSSNKNTDMIGAFDLSATKSGSFDKYETFLSYCKTVNLLTLF